MTENWVHLCVDVQRMFAEETPWHVPWLSRVAPKIIAVAERHPEKTIFTRFVPPADPDDMPGAWQNYYRKWFNMTRSQLPAEMIDLIAPLQRLVPPARVFDKMTYSPWTDGNLHAQLSGQKLEQIVISGGETEVCVLAAALGAIDLGYKVVLLRDAVCSGADETHDAILRVLESRFSVQILMKTVDEFLREC